MLRIKNENIKRLISLLYPFKRRIGIVVICALGSSALTTMQPLLRQYLIDKGIIVGDLKQVILISLLLFGIFVISQTLSVIQFYEYTYVNQMLTYRLFHNAFRHLLKLPVSFFKETNSVKLIGNIEYDISNIAKIADSTFVNSLAQGLYAIGGVVGLMIINLKLALLVLCVIPIKILINGYYSKRRTKAYENSMKTYTEFYEWKGEAIHGINLIKLWNGGRKKIYESIRLRRDIIRNGYMVMGTEQGNNAVSSTVDALLNGLLYVLCAILIFKEQLTLGGLFSFTSYSMTVISSISFLTRIKFYFAPIFPSLKRYNDFMGEKEEYTGRLEPSENPPHITFSGVTLNYSEEVTALRSVSLEIYAGEKVGIVGSNGSGKSSIIQLLLRLYEPSEGMIMYCGTDIHGIKIEKYRNFFSYVEQKPFLFNSSVRQNIDPMSTASDYEIIKAAKSLGLFKFINELPDGLDTIAGVDGSKFSGGERQKIAALRAWIKPHKILILDEIDNNLDEETKQLFNEIMINKGSSEIIIVVTHSADILNKMDRILLMNDGELAENGTYEELAAAGLINKYIRE